LEDWKEVSRMDKIDLESIEKLLREKFKYEYVKLESYDIRNNFVPKETKKIDFELSRLIFDFTNEIMNIQVRDDCIPFNKIQKLWKSFTDDTVLSYFQSLNSLYFGLYPKIRIISCNNQDVLIEIKFYSNYDKVKLKITLKI
jgi:hypothetical protein